MTIRRKVLPTARRWIFRKEPAADGELHGTYQWLGLFVAASGWPTRFAISAIRSAIVFRAASV
jgi:hypothetical protein